MFFDGAGRLWVEEVPVFIRGGRVYLVTEDSLGVNTVRVFGVRTSGGP